jgi:hypothetical protein
MTGGVVRLPAVPAQVLAEMAELSPVHYEDAYAVSVDPRSFPTVQDVARAFEHRPSAVLGALVTIRDALVRPLGLRRVGSFRQRRIVGDQVVFGGNDRHLDFRGSVLLDRHPPDGCRIVLSTLVHYNNRFGPVYFAVVKPFHRLLVRSMLRSRFGTGANPPERTEEP